MKGERDKEERKKEMIRLNKFYEEWLLKIVIIKKNQIMNKIANKMKIYLKALYLPIVHSFASLC